MDFSFTSDLRVGRATLTQPIFIISPSTHTNLYKLYHSTYLTVEPMLVISTTYQGPRVEQIVSSRGLRRVRGPSSPPYTL